MNKYWDRFLWFSITIPWPEVTSYDDHVIYLDRSNHFICLKDTKAFHIWRLVICCIPEEGKYSYIYLYFYCHTVKWWVLYDYSAANSCPASPRGGHGHGRRNVTSDLQMVAAYAAAVAGGGSSGPLQSVMSTITVASSSSTEDRSALESYAFGLYLYRSLYIIRFQTRWNLLKMKCN